MRLREGRSKEIYELKGSVDVEQQIGGRKPAEGEKEAAELEELHVLVGFERIWGIIRSLKSRFTSPSTWH